MRGKLGLVLMGGARLRKSLIQFSVKGWGCVPSLLFDLRPNYGGDNEDNGDFIQKVPVSAPNPAPGHRSPRLHGRLLDTHRQVWVSLLWGHCSFLLGPGAQGSDCAPKSLFPSPGLSQSTGKTIALTRRTFAGKVMPLLFNMLSRLVITFLPRGKCLLISWLESPSAVILEPPKIKSDIVSTVSSSISHEVMGQMP